MHIEFLVEEPSAEAALRNLCPQILGTALTFDMHSHGGKSDLLNKLPGRLRGYRAWIPDDWRIVVLMDEDRADCHKLKSQLEEYAAKAGLGTRATVRASQPYFVVNRLAVEELEAWFFEDVPALVKAYPGVSGNLGKQAKYRNPDRIAGGTWEQLERILQRAGYHAGGLPKIEAARRISEFMQPDRNTSKSFQVFRDTLRRLAASLNADG